MWSILDLWEAAFSDCCGFFISSGVSGKHELCSIIERTWGSVISLEAAYCCGASSLSRGIPKPPLARGSVITSCNLSVYGSNWPNKVGRSISWITSSIESFVHMQNVHVNLDFVTLCISNVSRVWVAFCNFRELQKLSDFPFIIFFAAILVFVVLWLNDGTKMALTFRWYIYFISKNLFSFRHQLSELYN